MYDRIIIGAGIYGLYAAIQCGKRGESVLVLEQQNQAFTKATYANQARVHMGYHYPRSLSTALKSARYFERFCTDYKECILREFEQIYATSQKFSYTSATQFKRFCEAAEIECTEINPKRYFRNNMCDGAFKTKEYTYDAKILRNMLLLQIEAYPNIEVFYNSTVSEIWQEEDCYRIGVGSMNTYTTKFLLNATYASTNQILSKAKENLFDIKYELCEIILCETNDILNNVGLTVMDGPFFSIMPFGKTNMHSLTSVSFTPHETSYADIPSFGCMKTCETNFCNEKQLGDCNCCSASPLTAWGYMSGLARKYVSEAYKFEYKKSLYSIKPILKSSEIDDSRPTVIRVHKRNPTFVSVLSGKINTIYDLDEVLCDER